MMQWSQRLFQRLGLLRTSLLAFAVTAGIEFYLCLPSPLFQAPTATVLTDTQGQLLGAHIAADGQWRFPACQAVPEKLEKALLYFEDQYFYYHPGINPVSMGKAFLANLRAQRIVRGGSTLSLQVIRMARQGKPRTLWEKCKEAVMALRLELGYTKQEILQLYASHAPFGTNVVGIDAAAWRYYGRAPDQLSWGEVCALAVLPNAPTLIYPGKNEALLRKKRDFLLDKLYRKGLMDATTCTLAKAEPLPYQPDQLPQIAPHLLQEAIKAGYAGQRIATTINKPLQVQTQALLERYHEVYCANEIYNGALVVVEVATGHVLAYHGNIYSKTTRDTGTHVNIITAPRGSGSTLKPFLHASMLQEGALLPHTLLPDIPTCIAGFKPKNASKQYSGAVPAHQALARSLNIPSVRLLRSYGVARFHELLQKIGFSTITKNADHYGLSLVLGGAEVTLEALVGVYASMARTLNHFHDYSALYDPNDYHGICWRPTVPVASQRQRLKEQASFFGAAPIWHTFEALSTMNRPTEDGEWKHFHSAKKIAWKTGTGHDHKDAWAIGVTPTYVVGVWIGNADGAGRPGMTGTKTAAPVMFDIFRLLPATPWFDPPYDDLVEVSVCTQSGYRAGIACDTTAPMYIPVAGLKATTCPYHQRIHLDCHAQLRVTSETYDISQMHTQSWFVLPPAMEWYYKKENPFYKPLPPLAPTCRGSTSHNMDIIYPTPQAKIYIPKDLDSQRQKTVFEATHRIAKERIYWHLNEQYLGSTSDIHQMEMDTEEGTYILTLVDGQGETLVRKFTVLGQQSSATP